MKRLIIIGAGGHGRVAADVARSMNKYSEIFFLDDGDQANLNELTVLGKVCDVDKFIDDSDFFVAVGDNCVRKQMLEMLLQKNAVVATLIHSSVQLGSRVIIGKGTILMAGAIVNCGTVLGRGVIINTCASVDHDCEVGDYTHVSVGAHLAGTVTVGQMSLIGAGATVINNICICDSCIVGAGAVVVNDINKLGTYVGVPAFPLREDVKMV